MCIVLPLTKGVNSHFTTGPGGGGRVVNHTLFSVFIFISCSSSGVQTVHRLFLLVRAASDSDFSQRPPSAVMGLGRERDASRLRVTDDI